MAVPQPSEVIAMKDVLLPPAHYMDDDFEHHEHFQYPLWMETSSGIATLQTSQDFGLVHMPGIIVDARRCRDVLYVKVRVPDQSMTQIVKFDGGYNPPRPVKDISIGTMKPIEVETVQQISGYVQIPCPCGTHEGHLFWDAFAIEKYGTRTYLAVRLRCPLRFVATVLRFPTLPDFVAKQCTHYFYAAMIASNPQSAPTTGGCA